MKRLHFVVMSCLAIGVHARQAAAGRPSGPSDGLPLGSFAGGAVSQLDSTITGAISGAGVADQINADDGLFGEETYIGLGDTLAHVLLASNRYNLFVENTARVDGLAPDAFKFDRCGGYTYARFQTALTAQTHTSETGGSIRFAFRLTGQALVSGDAGANASMSFNDVGIWSDGFSSPTDRSIDAYLISQPIAFTNGGSIPFNAGAWIDTRSATVYGTALTSSADVKLRFSLVGWIGDERWSVSDGATQIAHVPEPSACVLFALLPALARRRRAGGAGLVV